MIIISVFFIYVFAPTSQWEQVCKPHGGLFRFNHRKYCIHVMRMFWFLLCTRRMIYRITFSAINRITFSCLAQCDCRFVWLSHSFIISILVAWNFFPRLIHFRFLLCKHGFFFRCIRHTFCRQTFCSLVLCECFLQSHTANAWKLIER